MIQRIVDIVAAVRGSLQNSPYASVKDSSGLDAQLIVCHVLGIERRELLASYSQPVSEKLDSSGIHTILDRCMKYAEKRKSGYPVAYITGVKEFYGRPFHVSEYVLIPRPETETLIEWVLETLKSEYFYQKKKAHTPEQGIFIHDLCTGSGCIPITLALELQNYRGIHVSASDISRDAITVASQNARDLIKAPSLLTPMICSIEFTQSDLLANIDGAFDIITANPPYVRTGDVLSNEIMGWKEPKLALDGGMDGLDILRRLLHQAIGKLKPGAFLFVEYGDGQTEALLSLLQSIGYTDYTIRTDLAGLDRILRCRCPVQRYEQAG